jgi:hypothetical protein
MAFNKNNIGGQELQQRKQKSIDSLLINICMMNFKQRKSRRITFSNIEGEIALILWRRWTVEIKSSCTLVSLWRRRLVEIKPAYCSPCSLMPNDLEVCWLYSSSSLGPQHIKGDGIVFSKAIFLTNSRHPSPRKAL